MDPFFPSDFLRVAIDCERTGTTLPDLSFLLAEESFASVSLSWDEEGLAGLVSVEEPLRASFFPDYAKGDAIELFIDTRDHKRAGFASRFCHHFLLLPEETFGVRAEEITKFRSEDSRPLCDPEEIELRVTRHKKGYEAAFRLPKQVLYGYDPSQFPSLGFAYRIRRHQRSPQHFPFSSKYFEPGLHPALWASVHLVTSTGRKP